MKMTTEQILAEIESHEKDPAAFMSSPVALAREQEVMRHQNLILMALARILERIEVESNGSNS